MNWHLYYSTQVFSFFLFSFFFARSHSNFKCRLPPSPLTRPSSPRPSVVLAWQCHCCVPRRSVGGISRIPVCGWWLLPGSASFRCLSQSCTLLPSLPPPPDFPLPKISLSLTITTPSCLCFTHKRGGRWWPSPTWWLSVKSDEIFS